MLMSVKSGETCMSWQPVGSSKMVIPVFVPNTASSTELTLRSRQPGENKERKKDAKKVF